MRPAGRDEVDGAGPVGDGHRGVEHLEDPLEADERGHQVDPGVGEAGQRLVDAGDVGGQGDERAERDGAVDHQLAADAVDGGGADGADEAEGDEEHPAVHGRADADVAHLRGPAGELAASSS